MQFTGVVLSQIAQVCYYTFFSNVDSTEKYGEQKERRMEQKKMEISETISRKKDEMLTKALYNLSLFVLFHSLRLRSIKGIIGDGRGKLPRFWNGIRGGLQDENT